MTIAVPRRHPGPEPPVDPAIAQKVEQYLAKPYRMVIHGTPADGYLAEAPELPNCLSAGSTPEEAIAMLRDAMAGWLLVSLEQGDSIPEPSAEPETAYSGKFVLRVPRSLHRSLAERAGEEGVSLNQLVLAYISRGLGPAT